MLYLQRMVTGVGGQAGIRVVCPADKTFWFCRSDVYVVLTEDGNWGWWTGWDTCTAECNGGLQERYRYCDNPEPLYGGVNCTHSEDINGDEAMEWQERACGEEPCPGE